MPFAIPIALVLPALDASSLACINRGTTNAQQLKVVTQNAPTAFSMRSLACPVPLAPAPMTIVTMTVTDPTRAMSYMHMMSCFASPKLPRRLRVLKARMHPRSTTPPPKINSVMRNARVSWEHMNRWVTPGPLFSMISACLYGSIAENVTSMKSCASGMGKHMKKACWCDMMTRVYVRPPSANFHILHVLTRRGENVVAKRRWKTHILSMHVPSVLGPSDVKVAVFSRAHPSRKAPVNRQSETTIALRCRRL
mmetsp:Transcript_17196/g.49804  ORF Transcript_17196/g.49804 Transcript_17196/m.49804 type:complete len:252 (-) Transcript_17196:1706-2461(-)